MVVKSQLKLVKSLHQKKYRNQHELFFVEGFKLVNELLRSGFTLEFLCATKENIELFSTVSSVYEITEGDLRKISALKNPNGILAVFKMAKKQILTENSWVLALDAVQDPGNLGTIIRLCDWFGIQNLVCSLDTVDCYNPKVLQATMGSIARVAITYVDLSVFLSKTKLPVFGAFMKGQSVYTQDFTSAGILVMGNEANGISKELEKLITQKITIPQFGKQTAESLNVAMATGILLNEIRRG
ncbi:RNA methyltransferase [Croceivirga lutea]|uniref:TrmH family RNA methyltransferase n=1 Tax=Croceivirga lutea TaxID=1775167 RepID=UPI00163B078B|nr:RNA methyltransferase [Croceivirga lutea]GGG53104.1 RNA methyltransferase [Croceivirga lutea]